MFVKVKVGVRLKSIFFVLLFQIWRLVTCLLWYKVNFHWLMLLYFLYSYSQRLETGKYHWKLSHCEAVSLSIALVQTIHFGPRTIEQR